VREVYEALLEQHTGKNRSEFNNDTSFRDDFELDSLSIAMLYPEVEDTFNIHFSPLEDDLAEIFRTVGTLWRFIESKGSVS
jgi:acyl carrier protein